MGQMKKFIELMEASETMVFAYGRFNPPTTGHEKLIQKVVSVAGTNDYRIYPSHTQNAKKDPLPQALKTAYMRKMFKKYARNIIVTKSKNAIEIAVELYDQGYKNLVMIAGSDRVKVFDTMLNQYNGVEGKRHGYYKFASIDIVSAGERDPDSEGVEGMSASKMRAAATDGDFDSFSKGLPSGFADSKKLYRDVRKYMGIREERDMGDMTDFETLRDSYLTGKIWNVGDIVEANGVVGEIVRKGANYLSFMSEDGKVHKAWLHEAGWSSPPTHNNPLVSVKEPNGDHLMHANLSAAHGYWKLKEFSKNKQDLIKKIHKAGVNGKVKVTVGKQSHATKSISIGSTLIITLSKHHEKQVNEGVKDLPPHLQKLIKQLEKKEKELEKKGLKVQTFVYNPDTGKPDIEINERNYRKEYDNYQGQPEQITRRSSRNKARRVMGDKTKIGMDVGHKDNNPMNNDPKNLRNEDPSVNRREPRLREAFPVQVTVKDKKGKTHTTGTRDLRGATHALLIHYKEIPPVKGGLPGSKETKPAKTEIFLGTESELAKTAKRMLKQHPSKKYATGAEVVKLDQKMVKGATLGEEVELDENWWKDLWQKLSQITHPKGWDKILKAYVDGMKDPEHRKHPSAWAADVARQSGGRGLDGRGLVKYINTLVSKGKLPKELKAEYTLDEAKMSSSQIDKLKKIYEPMRGKRISTSNAEKLGKMMDTIGKDKEVLIQIVKADIPFVSTVAVNRLISKHNMKGAEINKLKKEEREDWSFRDFVRQIQERELTDTELKRREEIAKDLSDEDFKKRYGGRWKEVKMGVATKMAKKESLKT